MSPIAGAAMGVLAGILSAVALNAYLPLRRVSLLGRIALGGSLLGGIALGVSGALCGLSLPALSAFLVVSALLAALSLIDLATRRLPNMLVLLLGLWGVLQVPLGLNTWRSVWSGALFAAVMFGVLAVLGRGALGAGDVKLATALGAVLGLQYAVRGLVLGVLAGGVGALLLLATRSATRKDSMAYGPYLAAGAWVTLLEMLGMLA